MLNAVRIAVNGVADRLAGGLACGGRGCGVGVCALARVDVELRQRRAVRLLHSNKGLDE